MKTFKWMSTTQNNHQAVYNHTLEKKNHKRCLAKKLITDESLQHSGMVLILNHEVAGLSHVKKKKKKVFLC